MAVANDTHRRRLVGFGSLSGSPDNAKVWVMSVDAPTIWTVVPTVGAGPTFKLEGATFTFDSRRERYLLCGGIARNLYMGYAITLGETWELRIGATAVWRRLPNFAGRHGHTAVYDSLGDRLVVFGGSYTDYANWGGWSTTTYNTLFSLSCATDQWSTVVPTGVGPGPRHLPSAVMDSRHRRMWLYGGLASASSDGYPQSSFRDSLWALDLTGAPAWIHCPKSGDWPALANHGILTLDAAEAALTLLPSAGYSLAVDRWRRPTSDTGGWTLTPAAGVWPYGWQFEDRAGARSLGLDYTKLNLARLADAIDSSLEQLPLPTISRIPVRAGDRNRSAMAYDPISGSSYLFGGDFTRIGPCASPHGSNQDDIEFGDVWRIPSDPKADAVRLADYGPARSGHVMVIDKRQRLIVFGGRYSSSYVCATQWGTYYLGDAWAFNLTGAPQWINLAPTGTAPGLWEPDGAVYDQSRDRMIVMGVGPAIQVWGLELSPSARWSSIPTSGAPTGILNYKAAVLDPVGDRILVHSLAYDQTLWQLSLSTRVWSLVPVLGTPPPAVTKGSRAVYDPVGRRMLVYHGATSVQPVWELSIGATCVWRHLTATDGADPVQRMYPAVSYEPSTGRLLIFGGYYPTGSIEFGDLNVLSQQFATPTQVSVASAALVRGAAEVEWLVIDPPNDLRVEMSDGAGLEWSDVGAAEMSASDRVGFRSALLRAGSRAGFRLAWSMDGARHTMGEVWVSTPLRELALSLSSATATATPECFVTFADAGEARLEVLDLAGRIVGIPLRLQPTAESRRVELTQLHSAANGVYWIRLSQAGKAVTARLARVR